MAELLTTAIGPRHEHRRSGICQQCALGQSSELGELGPNSFSAPIDCRLQSAATKDGVLGPEGTAHEGNATLRWTRCCRDGIRIRRLQFQ